jgi:Short C-terminal domain
MYRRGPFWGGPYMRRRGFPLFPMGGYGMGMGGGLLGNLAAGGIGYLLGKQSTQQAPQYQAPQYQGPSSQYQTPQYQAPQTPQYQAPAVMPNQQVGAASGENEKLAQLKLLGHLHDSGLLTNDEFEAEKRKIMQGY